MTSCRLWPLLPASVPKGKHTFWQNWQNVNLADGGGEGGGGGGGGGVQSTDNWYSKGLMAFVKTKPVLKKDYFLAHKEINL